MNISKVVYIDESLYYYRRNTQASVTKPFRANLIGKWIWWVQYIEDYLSEHNGNDLLAEAKNGRIICSLIPLGGNALKIKSFTAKYEEFRKVLSQPFIQQVLGTFNTSHTKLYWRYFFFVARQQYTLQYMLLTWIMRKILSLRKS